MASFVIDAQRNSTSRGPVHVDFAGRRASRRPRRCALPTRSMVRNASTAGDTRSVDRRVISSGSSLEERFGYSRAVVTGIASTWPARRRSCPGTPTRPRSRTSRCAAASRSSASALAEAGASLRRRRAHPRLPDRSRACAGGDARARRGVRSGAPGVHCGRLRAARRALALRARGRGGAPMKQIYPASITGKGSRFAEGGSVLDHAFGKGDAYTLGAEEEYMLLDAETFDLVQHIDTVLAAVSGHELEPRINPELMQSVLEVTTPVCRTPADVAEQLRLLRSFVCDIARGRGMRVGSAGTHPFSLFERQHITAKDRYQRDGRPPAVHRSSRADLRAARARRRRRSGEGDSGRERAARAPHRARRALCKLTVLARRADRPSLVAPHGVRGAAAVRARRPASATTPTTPRSSGSSSARAASPTTRTSGGTSACIRGSARSRSGSAMRSRNSRT